MNLGHLDVIHYGHTLIVVIIGLLTTLTVSAQIISADLINKTSSSI